MRKLYGVLLILLLAALPMLAATRGTKPDHKAQKAARLQAERVKSRGGHERAMRIHAAGKPARTTTARTSSVRRSMLDSTAPPLSHVGFLAATSLWQEAYASTFIAKGDFNGDGKLDLFFDVYDQMGCGCRKWAVILGNGDGTFGAATMLGISNPSYTYMVFAGDLNGDNKDDIVVARYDSSVDVYLGNGDGTFQAGVNYTVPGGGWWGSVAYRLSGTAGHPDIAAVSGNTFSMLTNDGHGVFAPGTSVTYGSDWPGYPVIADINGDGKLDVAGEVWVSASNAYGLAVWLATDTGFADPVQYAQPGHDNSAYWMAAGDVNGDGKLDVISVNGYAREMMAYIQQADGTFVPKGPYFAGDYPYAVTLADVDGDGKAEVLVSNDDSGAVAVMKADANGNFTMTAAYDAGGWTWTPLAVGDFNGDGKLDFVAANDEMDISYFQNLGDGTFRAGRHFFPRPQTSLDNFSTWAYSIAVADFNGDGIPDAVTGEDGDDSVGVTVYLGKGDGTFKPAINLGSRGYMYYVAAGDLNGDGYADVVATDEDDYTVKVFLSNGDGTFQSPVVYPASLSDSEPYGLVVADLNGDGKLDVAVYNDYTVSVLLNDGTGALTLSAVETSLSEYGDRIAAGDVNGDGKMDLVTRNEYGVEVLLGNGDGTFQDATYIDFSTEDYWDELGLALADVNKDGKLDIVTSTMDYYGSTPVVRRSTTSTDAWDGVLVALGNGDGTFQDPVLNIVTMRNENMDYAYPWAVAVADIDGDGNPDILAATEYYGSVAVLYGRGDGTFYDPVEFVAANYGSGLAVADLNRDGALDVAMSSDDMGMSVLLNAGAVKLTAASNKNPAAAGDSVSLTVTAAASLNGVTATPGGTVKLMDGATQVGSGTLTNGSATIAISPSLAVGTHAVQIAFGGDTNFVPATAVFTQFVAGATDYDLSADKTSLTLKAGDSGVIQITVTPKNGFKGTVNFSCGTLPTGMHCTFTPASVTPNGADPVKVTLVVSTTAAVSAANTPGPLHNNPQLPLWASLWGMGAMGMVLAGGANRKRKAMMLLLFLALGLVVLLAGCGHVTDTKVVEKPVYVQQATPAGAQTVQVNATAVGGAKSLNLTITVN